MNPVLRQNLPVADLNLFLAERGERKPVALTELLGRIQLCELSLTVSVYTDLLRARPAYQIETIRDWVQEKFAAAPVRTSFESAAGKSDQWYLRRGADLHGPLTSTELVSLRTNESLLDQDICWNFAGNFKVPATAIPRGELPPDEIAYEFQRTIARVPFEAHVSLHGANGTYNGFTMDLSMEGIGLLAKTAMTIGEEVEVRLSGVRAETIVQAPAKIVSVEANGASYRIGLRFARLPRETRDALRALIRR